MNPAALSLSTAPAGSCEPLRGDQLGAIMRALRVRAGIKVDSSQGVIESCLHQRMGRVGAASIDDYLVRFDDSINARAEWLALVDLLTVKETRFFRQRAALECVADYVDKVLTRGPTPSELSFWSAGCSTGQELYSLAMVVEQQLRDRQPWLEWHGIGTDISFEAIHTAQQALYDERAIASVVQPYRDSYLEAAGAGQWRLSPNIRARTHFFHSNLLYVNSAPFCDFNIIFCQNVLIYFERDKQRWIIDQLAERLRDGGLLILGAGEDVRWLNSSMRRLQWPGVCAYTKTGG
ncbi:MAG: protein-glutamate O-methyltransferase CheR [Halioglobus sp.]|nr:protein-glutamate O-methyltransferase CheR [Halioglobus sp.]